MRSMAAKMSLQRDEHSIAVVLSDLVKGKGEENLG